MGETQVLPWSNRGPHAPAVLFIDLASTVDYARLQMSAVYSSAAPSKAVWLNTDRASRCGVFDFWCFSGLFGFATGFVKLYWSTVVRIWKSRDKSPSRAGSHVSCMTMFKPPLHRTVQTVRTSIRLRTRFAFRWADFMGWERNPDNDSERRVFWTSDSIAKNCFCTVNHGWTIYRK